MIQEFKEFIQRGNFLDLAVGFVVGVAVSGVITALVERLIMPVIGLLFGEPNFDQVGQFACDNGECAGSLGAILTALVNFLLVAFALFLIVKAYNKLQRSKPEEPEPEAEPAEVTLLREIRDAVARRPVGTPPVPEDPRTSPPA